LPPQFRLSREGRRGSSSSSSVEEYEGKLAGNPDERDSHPALVVAVAVAVAFVVL